MLKISVQLVLVYLYLVNAAQFALEMCLAAPNRQKIHKTPILAFKVLQRHCIRWQSRASVRLPIGD